MKQLTRKELYIGLEVYDETGIKGKVIDCSDLHNVLIESDEHPNGYWCCLCFDENCEEGIKDMEAVPFFINSD